MPNDGKFTFIQILFFRFVSVLWFHLHTNWSNAKLFGALATMVVTAAVACANVEFNVCQLSIHSQRLRCDASWAFVQPNIACKFSRLQIPFKNVFQCIHLMFTAYATPPQNMCSFVPTTVCALSIAIFPKKKCNLRSVRSSYIMWRKFLQNLCNVSSSKMRKFHSKLRPKKKKNWKLYRCNRQFF